MQTMEVRRGAKKINGRLAARRAAVLKFVTQAGEAIFVTI